MTTSVQIISHCCYVSCIITLPPIGASRSLGPGCRARVGRAGALSAIVRGDPPLFLPPSVRILTRRASRYGTLRAQSRLSVRQEPEEAPLRRSHAIDRPSHAPAAAGNRHGRGRTRSAARVACGRMARLTHEPIGSLDVDEGIRLGVRVTPAFETPSGTCPPMASLRTAIAQACSSRRPMGGTASPRPLIPYRSSSICSDHVKKNLIGYLCIIITH